MPLEFIYDNLLIIRVDGDVAEIFSRGAFSHRVPLAWLGVQVEPSIKGHLVVQLTSTQTESALYEVLPKARSTRGTTVNLVIKTEEEPLFRQFFTQVGRLCGRPVAL